MLLQKKYACAKTKTTPVLGEKENSSKVELINAMKNGLFSITNDGNNKFEKYYPFVVTFLVLKVIICSLFCIRCLL